jgi:hypothetical protein
MTKTKNVTVAVSSIIASILVISLCLTSCIVSGQLLWAGCIWWECAPSRSFDVLDLGLSADLFPANAVEHPIHLSDDDDPTTRRSSFQSFYWDGGNAIAIYSVDTYASNRSAQKNFELHKNSFFSDWGDTKILWSRPEELTYTSPLADNFFVACGTLIRNDYRCAMIARYQEFVVFSNATISEDMTYEDFQTIVIEIDEKISEYLYKK